MTTFSPSVPEHIVSIATSAILVAVEIHGRTGSKSSAELAGELTRNKNADADAAKVTKELFAGCPEHHALTKFRSSITNGLNVYTYEWAGRLRLLPMTRYDKFMDWYKNREQEHERLKQEFLTAYPLLVNNAAYKAGMMFNRADYPTVDELRDAFSIRLYQAEVPTGDFRVSIADSLAEDLRKHYTQQASTFISEVMNTQTEQMVGVLTSIQHCCGFDTKTDKDGNTVVVRRKLYEGTIEKALELCETLEKFNPGGSTALFDARVALQNVLRDIDPKKLRNSDTQRVKLGEEVDDILKLFNI